MGTEDQQGMMLCWLFFFFGGCGMITISKNENNVIIYEWEDRINILHDLIDIIHDRLGD